MQFPGHSEATNCMSLEIIVTNDSFMHDSLIYELIKTVAFH